MTTFSSQDPVLSAQQISFSYPGRTVFAGWSGTFCAGITWLRGSNGSGKSTLLKLSAGALPIAAGELTVRGVDESLSPLDYRREVFWCGPSAMPFDHLRPGEYFGFIKGLYPQFDDAQLAVHIEGLGLNAHLDQRLSALSTGNQRKVWLAAALAVGTAAVLLDEPLNALDQTSLAYLLKALARKTSAPVQAWVIASHEALGDAGERAQVLQLAV
ncbi:MAG: ATP-binding cassette domain-containing protein [Rhizobacter sp.]